ncbi:MAG: hypothetical protein HYZ27_11270, partial [Deltaproteobacteria bacterium]|nr:hypothetical protein [Deltaproteobacteria bacterium]
MIWNCRGLLPALVLLIASDRATANSDSLLTLGAGIAFGATRDMTDSETTHGFSTDLNLVLRFPRFLAVEIAYSPTDRIKEGDDTVLDSRFRASGRLYLAPTYPVGFYVKGGVGVPDAGTLFSALGASTSYHAGAGLDLHTGDHLVTTLEVLADIPSFRAWDQGGIGAEGTARLNVLAMVRHVRVRAAVG